MNRRSALIFSPGAAGPLLADEPDWRDFAACQYTDPELWFVEKGQSTGPAKAVCRGCTVREQCLEYALDPIEAWGVWGGLSEQERRRAARLLADGWTIADIITAYDAAFYARAGAAEEAAANASERKHAGERERRAAKQAEIDAGGEKHCAGPCGQSRPLDQFSPRSGGYRYATCKECRAEAARTVRHAA
jgi:WhiB family transcriptional regulator, redox-sensing transcriptional regulator